MRSESEDQSSLEQSKSNDDEIPEFHNKEKISYTRNYLLSLSKLDTCKRLPSGLDRSILSGICDSWTGLLQPSHRSDSGRSHGYLSRRCPNLEDGLLGSGICPKVSSCVPGASPPLVKDNGHRLLNRSNAAYQPPHRFKAKVQSRTESEDLYNNETFDPSDHPGQEREEEEKRRRDSFELMRKEQHKTFLEKENKECHEHKENLDTEIATALEASGNYKRHVNQCKESEECAEFISPSSNSTGQDFTAQTSASGNLLPSAMENRTPKMNFGTDCLTHAFILEPYDGIRDQTKDYRFQSPDFGHQFLGGFAKDSQKPYCLGTQEDSFGMFTRNDWLKPHKSPIQATGNNAITPTVDESGSIEINRGGIISEGCAKQTVVSQTDESLSIFEDIDKLTGFSLGSELESKTSSVNGFHESTGSTDEICLPEEDSLITVDDFIIPQDSTFVADRGSAKADLFTFNSQVDISNKLEALNLSLSDQISTQLALDGPIFDSYDVMGLKTSYQHLHTQQSLPQFGKYQMNLGRAFFKSSHPQEVQKSFNTKSFDSETYLYNPQPLHHHFPANVLADHSQNPHADLRKFGHPINSPLLQRMPVPSNSSPHQVHGLPRTLPSPHPINKLTCYPQELPHQTQNFSSYYKQQHYRPLEMPIADDIEGGISDKAALNRLFEMEDRSRQIHSPSMAGRSV